MAQLLVLNPAPRKGSAAAKAMMAAVREGRSPKKFLSVVKSGAKAPAKHHKKHTGARNAVAAVKKTKRKFNRSAAGKGLAPLIGMAKTASVGAAGAVAVDVAFGYAKQYLPISMQTPQDLSTGGLNPMYFLAKAGVAVGLGLLGRKVTRYAGTMAEGALTVNAYEVLKSFVPASIQMGAYVPMVLPAQDPSNVTRLPARGMGMYVPASRREAVRANR